MVSIDEVIDCLNKKRIRATYSAVGMVIGCDAKEVPGHLQAWNQKRGLKLVWRPGNIGCKSLDLGEDRLGGGGPDEGRGLGVVLLDEAMPRQRSIRCHEVVRSRPSNSARRRRPN